MSTLLAQLCSPEEQVISGRGNAPLHCLTRNESIVLAVRAYAVIHARFLTFAAQFVAQSGALSLTACVVTFALILASTDTFPLPTSS